MLSSGWRDIMIDSTVQAINKAYSFYLQNQNLEKALRQILELLADPGSDEYACVARVDNPGRPDVSWTPISSIGTWQPVWEPCMDQAIRHGGDFQSAVDKKRTFYAFPIHTNGVFSALLILALPKLHQELLPLCHAAVNDIVAHGFEEQTRQQLEKNLIEQTYLLALTEKIAQLGHWKIDLETEEVVISDEVYRILNLNQGDFLRTPEGLAEFFHPDDQQQAKTMIQEAITNRSEFDFELRINPRYKANMVVRTMGFSPDNQYENSATIIGTIQDVTERVAQTRELQESELTLEKLHLITSESKMTLEEKILALLRMCSQKFSAPYAIFGKKDEEGFQILQAISPVPGIAAGPILNFDFTPLHQLLEKQEPIAFKNGENVAFGTHREDDKIRFKTFIGAPIFVNSKLYGSICFSDTHKREADFTPKDMNLLQIVASWIGIEMSREEFQKHLQILKERAEDASRAKSEFLTNMSHELLTPINGVVGLANLLAESDLDQKQAQLMRGIVDSGNRLLSMVTDVLDLSKLEEGQVLIQKHSFPLSRLLDQVVRETDEMLQNKNIRLTYHYDSSIPGMIVSDENHIKRILTKLTQNAVKFTEEGDIKIEVSRHEQNRIRFVVSDSGVGIPEDQLTTIFQKFNKGDSTTKQRFGGMGLGLAITHELVKLLGGTIEVESVPEKGTKFLFTIEMVTPDKMPLNPYLGKEKPLPTRKQSD